MLKFKSKSYGDNNQTVVFLLTGWGGTLRKYWFVSKLLEISGFNCITYVYERKILSPNLSKTTQNFLKVKQDVLKKINLLKRNGYKTFYLFGHSLGTLLAFQIANQSKDVSKIIVNLIGADLAETVWSWNTYKKGFKESLLEQGITLSELKKAWSNLGPIRNIDTLGDKKILVYLAKKDKIMPYDQGIKLLEKLKELKYDYRVIVNKHSGHYLGSFVNMLRFWVYLKFLKEN